ncbi:MAG TPA: NRAMP family divalent metal transporter [Vicinamibacteria bacterium]|nr:NRAMP family divalent metal transporter [Vicinamibacteria bacterium]
MPDPNVPEAPAPSRNPGALAGAAFLMATSAIGPGFLTQTAFFTDSLRASFAFAILASVLVDLAVQANVWRILGVARRRGQELASELLPGLGGVVAALVAAGGFVFNVGNIAGCGMGLEVLGLSQRWGALLSALMATGLLALPRAGQAMDLFTKVLGGVMIALTAGVMVVSKPDYLGALRGAFLPGQVAVLPVVTLVGGTVGGYITFSGVHRLLDAGIGGPGAVGRLTRASILGILVTAAMRVLLFLAILGVVSHAGSLDPANPAASAFRLGAGEWGYRFFGVVLWSAAITSVVGCSYTSLSFVRSFSPLLERRSRQALAVFIGLSLLVYLGFGRPVSLLILAGGLNGLILPVTLGVVLLAARRRDLMGEYRHPLTLQVVGWVAWGVSLLAGGFALKELARLVRW